MNTTSGPSSSRTYTGFAVTGDHSPDETVINLDYPMYGNVTIKANGKRFTLDEVKAALKLVEAARRSVG